MTPLLLVAALLAKHWVCDFVLQTPWQIRCKRIYGAPGGLLHAGIHAAATAAILAAFPVGWQFLGLVVLAEFVFHYHVDWTKEQFVAGLAGVQGAAFWALFGFDQLLHHLTYVFIAALV